MFLKSFKVGLSFGLTSGVITTLGLLVGLISSGASREVIITGILTIALADSLSDALGVHMSEESMNKKGTFVLGATLSTFLFKLLTALSFMIPILFLPITTSVIVSVLWGFLLLIILSIFLAKSNKDSVLSVVIEHVSIVTIVIVLTYYLGNLISDLF